MEEVVKKILEPYKLDMAKNVYDELCLVLSEEFIAASNTHARRDDIAGCAWYLILGIGMVVFCLLVLLLLFGIVAFSRF